MDRKLTKRFWEIDFLRGISLAKMVIYHLLYNLNYFGQYDINLNSTFWLYASVNRPIFIFLVGVSLTLSFSKAKKSFMNEKRLFLKYLIRGLKIFSWGLIITLVTRVFLREGYVVFGVLHLIGISIILAYPFLKLRLWNLIIGILLIFLGLYLKDLTFNFYWLVWLGLKPVHFYSVDYFPLLPWFGVVLMGIFIGNLFYPDRSRKFHLPDFSDFYIIKSFCFLGKHSLFIYLIHQPLIIAFLYLFGLVSISL